MLELTNSFKESIFDAQIDDAMLDLTKIEIGKTCDDFPGSSIPFFKELLGVGKTITDIRNLLLMYKTAEFLKEFHSRDSNYDKKIEKYKRRLEKDKYAQAECGRVLIILDQLTEIEKAKLLARLYRAYIDEKYDWETFCELSSCLQMLFIQDIKMLARLANKEDINVIDSPESINRLQSIGLITTTFTRGEPLNWDDLGNSKAYISKLGLVFYNNAIVETKLISNN